MYELAIKSTHANVGHLHVKALYIYEWKSKIGSKQQKPLQQKWFQEQRKRQYMKRWRNYCMIFEIMSEMFFPCMAIFFQRIKHEISIVLK